MDREVLPRMGDVWSLVLHLRNLSLNLSSSSRLCPNSSSRQSCPISSSRSKASVRLVAEARRLRSSSFSCCKSLGGRGEPSKTANPRAADKSEKEADRQVGPFRLSLGKETQYTGPLASRTA